MSPTILSRGETLRLIKDLEKQMKAAAQALEFEKAAALDRLEAFASFHGADFYGLPRNTERITLVKQPWQVAVSLGKGDDSVIPFRAGKTVAWQLAEVESK